MARGVLEIQFDYQQAVRRSEELKSVARDLKNVAEKGLETILDELGRVWQSDNSPQFIQKTSIVAGDIARTARELEETAETIRAVAERVKQAELASVQIAQERNLL